MITLHNVNPEFICEGYISLSKCLRVSDDRVVNNGRVYSASQLANLEIWYNVHDVQVVTSYIQEKIENEGSIAVIPLTNTGYVRNYCREYCFTNMQTDRKLRDIQSFLYHDKMKALQIGSVNEYKELKYAFAGGFTHANMIHSCKTLKGMSGADLCSSYPTVACAEKFPMGRGIFVGKSNLDKLHDCREKIIVLYV